MAAIIGVVTLGTTLTSLDAQYDYVAIIDSLSKADRATYRLSHSLMDVLHSLSYGFTTYPCDTLDGFRRAHAKIQKRAEAGHPAVIVLVGHGNEARIGIGESGESMSWVDLARLWTPINAAMGGTLLVMMTTCEGINAISASASALGEPFFGLIGTKEKLLVKDARAINEQFFKGLRDGIDIKNFIEEAEQVWGDNFVRGITSEFWQSLKKGTLGLR